MRTDWRKETQVGGDQVAGHVEDIEPREMGREMMYGKAQREMMYGKVQHDRGTSPHEAGNMDNAAVVHTHM